VVVRDIEIGDPQDLQDSLKRVHGYMSDQRLASQANIQTDLEDLYGTFIRPISDLLDGMEPEDKLVFALDDVGNLQLIEGGLVFKFSETF
jgi:hypothetical protein